MIRSTMILSLVLALVIHPTDTRAELNLTVENVGLSLGNSPRVIGIRVNAVDSDVQRVDGLNLTLWNPRPSPRADFNGLAIGVIGPKARRLHGIAAGGIGATATDRILGLAFGGFGVGANHLGGVAASGFFTETKSNSWGLVASGLSCRAHGRLDGIAVGGGFVNADSARGIAIGGLAVMGRSMDGLALSTGIAAIDGDVRGLCAGGLVAGAENLRGIVLSPGGVAASNELDGLAIGGLAAIGGRRTRGVAISGGVAGAVRELDGIALGGLGVGAGERIRGLALGGLVSMAREVEGISFGALNGVIIRSINLDDFLDIRTVNQRYTGLSLGLFNYSAELHGVQLGLFNYAANNPKWARLLPFINVHI